MTKERYAAENLSRYLKFSASLATSLPIRQTDIFTYELEALVGNGVHLKSRPKHPR